MNIILYERLINAGILVTIGIFIYIRFQEARLEWKNQQMENLKKL